MKQGRVFRTELFRVAVENTCRERGCTLRKAAEASGVSPSTLTRIVSQGKQPDMDSFAKLVYWGGYDANWFIHEHEYDEWTGEQDTLSLVCMILREDTHLPYDATEKLLALLRMFYETMRSKE